MNSKETPLQPMLEGTKQYIVPLFQREYCWTKDEWEELWRDLVDLYESDTNKEHFVGTVVTMPVDMQPHGVSKYLLIDGQQRITTIFLILSAIRDLNVGQSSLADQINELYLINKWGEGSNRFKLLPTETDRDSFISVIEGKEKEKDTIVDAYKFFIRLLRGRDSNNQPFDLKRLHDVIMRQFVFVSVVLDREDSPYRIFHSLNGTGVPLTQADLVRNHFFMYIPDPDEQKTAYHDLWMPMQNMLGKKITQFIWRYITKDGTSVRQNGIYDEIRQRTNGKDQNEVIDILLDLKIYADYYYRLINPDYEENVEIRRRLKRINRWEISTCYPFLLNIYNDYFNNKIDSDEFCEILAMIESYVVRRFFARIPTNVLNKNFIPMYRTLDKDKIVESAQEYLLARRWATDEEFLAGWEYLPIYTSGTAKCRHILESIEEGLTNNNEPIDVKHPSITIEHVMPQTTNEKWLKELGENADKTRNTYLHTIGNLTLTGMNESMGNAPYYEKKSVLTKSNFNLNSFFAECDQWNSEIISERASALGEIALQIWTRPDQAIEYSPESDPTGHKPTGYTIFEQDYDATAWREILIGVSRILAMKYGESHFGNVMSWVAGKKRQYIAYSSESMSDPVQLENTPFWIETNMNAKMILSTTYSILRACGHEDDELKVYW